MFDNGSTDVLSVQTPTDFEAMGIQNIADMNILIYFKILNTELSNIFTPKEVDFEYMDQYRYWSFYGVEFGEGGYLNPETTNNKV